jgi:hypothetical protein
MKKTKTFINNNNNELTLFIKQIFYRYLKIGDIY